MTLTYYGTKTPLKPTKQKIVEVTPHPCEGDDSVYTIHNTTSEAAVDIAHKFAILKGIEWYDWDDTNNTDPKELPAYSYMEGAFYEVIQRQHDVYHIHSDVEKLRGLMKLKTLAPLHLIDKPYAESVWHHDTYYRHYTMKLTLRGIGMMTCIQTCGRCTHSDIKIEEHTIDYIVVGSRPNGEACEEVGVIGTSEEDAIESAKDILIVNNGYDRAGVEALDYVVSVDSLQECECQICKEKRK